MRMLFLSQLFPYPPICGGTIKSYNLLKHLAERHKVSFVSFVRKQPSQQEIDAVASICKEVRTIPIKRSAAANLRFAVESLATGQSFIVARDRIRAMQRLVDDMLRSRQFDLVYVDHLQMAQYTAGWDRCPKVLDEHNVEWKIIQRIAENHKFSPKGLYAEIEWRNLRRWELNMCGKFDLVFTVTENDRETLTSANENLSNVLSLPIGVDVASVPKIELNPEAKDILSIGTMSWPPNIDAIEYFASDIYPLVKVGNPAARLVVAGSSPPESIRKLSRLDSSIEVTGFVEDLASVASKAAVFIVPLRSGSGLRVKILNAMAMGLPVVSTSVGCEGIGAENNRHLLIADNPREFADSVLRLISDFGLRRRLGEAGKRFVSENYSWEAIYDRMDQALRSLVPEGEDSGVRIRRRSVPPPYRLNVRQRM
jgi:sugar transferase (PEP-CTERM/EpsH1 system associated)